MTFEEFKTSLSKQEPPSDLNVLQEALWRDAKGEWERAHAIVQDEHSTEAAWVHAYLHRKEGDNPNASYWYGRCGRPLCSDKLDREWERIVRALL